MKYTKLYNETTNLCSCGKSGKEIELKATECSYCRANFLSNSLEFSSETPLPIRVLKIFAYIDLIVGIIAGLFTIKENGILGLAFILQGILICSLFLVIALIAENIIEIRKNTTQKK